MRRRLTPDQQVEADAVYRALQANEQVHPKPSLADVERMYVGRGVEAPTGRQIVPLVLSTVEPTRTRWAWEGRVPIGAVTILAGRQGLGKSTQLAHLSADLTLGKLPGDLAGAPSTVLLATYEDDYASTVAPRLIAAGADLNCVVGLDLMEDGKPDLLSLPGDLELIAKTAKEYQARVLMIDPLMAALPGGIDSHRDQDVRRALAPLGQLAIEADLAIIAVLHLRKGASNEALDRVSGSVAFTAAARSVLAFGRADEDEDGTGRVLAHAKSNLGPLAPSLAFHIESASVDHKGSQIPTSRLVCDGETDFEAGELLSPAAEDRTEADVAADWLADYLGDGEWHVTAEVREAGKAAEHASRTLQRAAKRLGVQMDRRAPEGSGGRGSAVGHWRLVRCGTAPAVVAPGGVGATTAPGGWRDKVSGSTGPNPGGRDPMSRQEQNVGATIDERVADAERIAVKFEVAV